MSDRQPRISGKQLIAALGTLGFSVIRVRGSHHFVRHQDGRTSVVPVHGKETMGPGLLGKIPRACELTRDDFQDALDS